MAIITNVEPRVMLFISNQHEDADLYILNTKAFCQRHDCMFVHAQDGDLDQSLGNILGLFEALKITPKPDLETPGEFDSTQAILFLLCGFEAERRDQILKAMNEEQLAKGALKAMATDNNIHWTLKHILSDVQLEHQIMTAYMELRQTVRVCEVMNETAGLPHEVQQVFDQKMAQAKNLLQSDPIPTDVEAMKTLSQMLKWLITFEA